MDKEGDLDSWHMVVVLGTKISTIFCLMHILAAITFLSCCVPASRSEIGRFGHVTLLF